MSREERDLIVRWLRAARRETLLPTVARAIARQLARVMAINPRTLPSVPSPRAG